MNNKFLQGVKLFNKKKYFECPDVLESLWKELPENHNDKKFYQGTIQLAIALYLISQKRYKGSEKMHKRVEPNLSNYSGLKYVVDLNSLLTDVKKYIDPKGQSGNPKVSIKKPTSFTMNV